MNRFSFGICLILLAGNVASAQQETSHYPAGAEGLKGASLPPPGTYLKWYNIVYTADTLRDRNGNAAPVGLDLDVFATVPRLIKMTDQKFLGADYGMDIAVPFLNVDLQVAAAGINQSKFGLGDILIEPLVLGWHFEQWDVAAAAGVWCPTGDFSSTNPIHIGKGFWTGMFTLGATYYFDEDKTWHLSGLGRYETNSTKTDIDLRPGDDFHIEWGLGKSFGKNWNVGLTAYTHWQVTSDSGSAALYDTSVHDRFYSLGPEVVYFCVPYKTFFSVRYQREFGAIDRVEGHNTVISLTKIF
ncbi:MAG: transporter [Candidatus Saccharimonas sp.]|nr:transporter [Planctomycetaceae bacterium]